MPEWSALLNLVKFNLGKEAMTDMNLDSDSSISLPKTAKETTFTSWTVQTRFAKGGGRLSAVEGAKLVPITGIFWTQLIQITIDLLILKFVLRIAEYVWSMHKLLA